MASGGVIFSFGKSTRTIEILRIPLPTLIRKLQNKGNLKNYPLLLGSHKYTWLFKIWDRNRTLNGYPSNNAWVVFHTRISGGIEVVTWNAFRISGHDAHVSCRWFETPWLSCGVTVMWKCIAYISSNNSVIIYVTEHFSFVSSLRSSLSVLGIGNKDHMTQYLFRHNIFQTKLMHETKATFLGWDTK